MARDREKKPDPGASRRSDGNRRRAHRHRRRRGGGSTGRNLPMAIAVGTGLLVIFVAALYYHPVAFTAVIGLLTAVAYVESARVLRTAGHHLDVAVLVVTTFVMLFGAYHARHAGQVIGVLVLVASAFVWHVADPARRDVLRASSTTVLFGLWVGFLASFAVLLVTRPVGGVIVVLAVIGSAVLGDVGAFSVGVWLGRRPVAPSLSPNKTWEGLAGGVLTAMIVATAVLPFVEGPFDLISAPVVAGACALAAFGGDLVESMIKRDLGVKDLGEVLPGHGGILDRVDGILFALPVGFYVTELVV